MITCKPAQLPLYYTGTGIEKEKLFDRQDLLQMFHISVRTLQYWRSKGILPYSKIGNKIYYRQKDVDEMLLKYRLVKKI